MPESGLGLRGTGACPLVQPFMVLHQFDPWWTAGNSKRREGSPQSPPNFQKNPFSSAQVLVFATRSTLNRFGC